MTFLKIGNRMVNLDHVASVVLRAKSDMYYANGDENALFLVMSNGRELEFSGGKAAVLRDYFKDPDGYHEHCTVQETGEHVVSGIAPRIVELEDMVLEPRPTKEAPPC